MNPSASARRLTAWTAMISMPLAFACMATALVAVHYDFKAFDDPASQIGIGAGAAPLLYASMILDMLGYYLLLLPGVVYLWLWLCPRDSFQSSLYAAGGLGYVLIGAAGAATLAAAWPPLMAAYDASAGAERERVRLLFEAITNTVYGGLWNRLEVLLAGVWWLGTGLLLRAERPAFGLVTIGLGVFTLLDAAGSILQVPALASLGLFIYLFVAPVWAFWLGWIVLRGAGAGSPTAAPDGRGQARR